MKTLLNVPALTILSLITLNAVHASAILPPPGSSFFCSENGQAATVIIMDDKTINFAGPGMAGTATEDANTQTAALRIDFDNISLTAKQTTVYKNLSDIRVTLSDDRQSITKIEAADSDVIVHTFTNCQSE